MLNIITKSGITESNLLLTKCQYQHQQLPTGTSALLVFIVILTARAAQPISILYSTQPLRRILQLSYRITSWPAPQTPCCHCCDKLIACCCRCRLILTLVVNAVFVLFLFSGTKYYYWCRGQHIACILSAIVYKMSSVAVLTRVYCDEAVNY